MTRFSGGVQGPSADDVTKRQGEAVEGADDVLRLASELGARVEKAKAGGLARERARLARKYGGGSAEAARAEVALSRQGLALEAAAAEAQTALIPVSPLDEGTTRVHGRAVDGKRSGIANIEARLLDAQGKALAKAATDENGYFRLDVKTPAKAGPAKTARRIVTPPSADPGTTAPETPEHGTGEAATAPTWTLVLARGGRELARTAIEEVTPGEARYCELEVPDRSR
jgi:hypothetical protein